MKKPAMSASAFQTGRRSPKTETLNPNTQAPTPDFTETKPPEPLTSYHSAATGASSPGASPKSSGGTQTHQMSKETLHPREASSTGSGATCGGSPSAAIKEHKKDHPHLHVNWPGDVLCVPEDGIPNRADLDPQAYAHIQMYMRWTATRTC